MSKPTEYTAFAQLFRKYRLKSEIESLAQFADIFADEGYVYDVSLYTHWQRGDRLPRNREVILKLIELFIKRGGISNISESNTLLEAANQRDLSATEEVNLEKLFGNRKGTSIPEELALFIGREEITKNICWDLLNNRKVLLHGVPGSGKTALAIKIAHMLQGKFIDGVYWFRTDTTEMERIVDELLSALGVNTQMFKEFDSKLKKLIEISKVRKFILIFDNFDEKIFPIFILEALGKLNSPILFTSVHKNVRTIHINKYSLSGFLSSEFIILSEAILGKPFVTVNKSVIEKLGQMIEYLPITSMIVLKQILSEPLNMSTYIENIERKEIDLKKISYDNKNLYTSFRLAFDRLDPESQTTLVLSSLFQGAEFSAKAVSYIMDRGFKSVVQSMEYLNDLSLIEKSTYGRYRIHPAMKVFVRNKLDIVSSIVKAVNYYEKKYPDISQGEDVSFVLLGTEFDNIIGLINEAYENRLYSEILKLWGKISTYFWLTGNWRLLHKIDPKIQEAYRRLNDLAGLSYYYMEVLGKVYFFQGHKEKSFIYLKKAMIIAAQLNDKFLLGIAKQKYGIVSLDKGDAKMAEGFLLDSIALLDRNTHMLDLMKSYSYLGHIYVDAGIFKKAIKYLKTAYRYAELKKSDDLMGIACLYLGDYYYKEGNFKISKKFYKRGSESDRRIKRKVGYAFTITGLARSNSKLLKTGEAIKYYHLAQSIYKELGMSKHYSDMETEIDTLQS